VERNPRQVRRVSQIRPAVNATAMITAGANIAP
jgi:hypothetical protein